MSIVPATGAIRKHFEEAIENDDQCSKSSAFWQAYLQQEFSEVHIEPVTSESSTDSPQYKDNPQYKDDINVDFVSSDSPPGGSQDEDDIVTKTSDPDDDDDDPAVLLWVKGKLPTDDVQEVEKQALDAARNYVLENDLLWLYVLTTVGVSFRTWFVDKDKDYLQPLHGTSPVEADRQQYIRADSDDAIILARIVHMISSQTPFPWMVCTT